MPRLSEDGPTPRPQHAFPPVVVGGIGGSGTRVVVQLLQAAGLCMGKRLNASLDLLDFVPQFEAHVPAILNAVRSPTYDLTDLGTVERSGVMAACHAIIHALEQQAEGRPWGWKNPRIIYLLPFIQAVAPQMRFVQVVRDGRDMALSGNQNQLRSYGRYILGDDATDPVAAARFWQVVNLAVAAWSRRHLPGRHLCLRYEDLLLHPAQTAARLLDFIAAPALAPATLERWQAGLRASPGMGRWQALAPPLQQAIGQACAAGLASFGYLPPEPAPGPPCTASANAMDTRP